MSSDPDAIPDTRRSVVVELGLGIDPAAVTCGLDERALEALQVALRRCRCARCIKLRGGAS